MSPRIGPDRLVPMGEVAKLLGLEGKRARRNAWRLIRRLELRDGVRYLVKPSASRNGHTFCSLSALELLLPFDPNTMKAMRGRILTCEQRLDRHSKQIKSHGVKIREIKERQAADRALMAAISKWTRSRVDPE
jgi:hypothetical protein